LTVRVPFSAQRLPPAPKPQRREARRKRTPEEQRNWDPDRAARLLERLEGAPSGYVTTRWHSR
jgi:hypothetical protein